MQNFCLLTPRVLSANQNLADWILLQSGCYFFLLTLRKALCSLKQRFHFCLRLIRASLFRRNGQPPRALHFSNKTLSKLNRPLT